LIPLQANRWTGFSQWLLIGLVYIDYAGGECADKTKEHLPPDSEELQHINEELEKEYVFALKKVK